MSVLLHLHSQIRNDIILHNSIVTSHKSELIICNRPKKKKKLNKLINKWIKQIAILNKQSDTILTIINNIKCEKENYFYTNTICELKYIVNLCKTHHIPKVNYRYINDILIKREILNDYLSEKPLCIVSKIEPVKPIIVKPLCTVSKIEPVKPIIVKKQLNLEAKSFYITSLDLQAKPFKPKHKFSISAKSFTVEKDSLMEILESFISILEELDTCIEEKCNEFICQI